MFMRLQIFLHLETNATSQKLQGLKKQPNDSYHILKTKNKEDEKTHVARLMSDHKTNK
jgi:hypothetical protein